MYLKQTPQRGGRVSLSIVESWWDPGTGRSRQRTVENLGHLDALAAEHARFPQRYGPFTPVVPRAPNPGRQRSIQRAYRVA